MYVCMFIDYAICINIRYIKQKVCIGAYSKQNINNSICLNLNIINSHELRGIKHVTLQFKRFCILLPVMTSAIL